MSLFPAYESQTKQSVLSPARTQESDKDRDGNWLSNSSFQTSIIPQTPVIELSSESSDNESVQVLPTEQEEKYPVYSLDSDSSCELLPPAPKKAKKKKKKTRRHDRGPTKIKYERDVENVYFEDKTRDRGNNYVDTLCARVRPIYTLLRSKSVGFVACQLEYKKGTVKRYFATNLDTQAKSKKTDTTIKRGVTKKVDVPEENLDYLPNAEEEQKSRVKEFNQNLTETPHDVGLWLEYVAYQDMLQRFEMSQTQNYHSAVCQKKLSIVERALERNPDSQELLRKKLYFLGELYPADQFSSQLETMLNKDTGNVMLWQALIMATQCSVAMCTVPKVMELYSKCFGKLRTWTRTSSRNHDEKLLEMLYQCFVFLRQAGLWEQMWETLRLNLTLNLGLKKDSLRFQRSIDEKKLIEMEEVILTSRLPLNQLWLRVESLRENCHWISIGRDQLDLIGDAHRYVSPEAVTDYVHPMLTQDLNMRMAIYALTTLKVPLLPTSDTIVKELSLDRNDWTIDSIEPLLPMFYPCVGEVLGYGQQRILGKGLIAAGLTSGPQYLRYHPAQEPYLDFVRDTFRVIAESFSSSRRTSLYVWWLRFEKMLVCLCKEEPKSETRYKKLKGLLKEFLKKSENRNNLHFYREYALIEREMGRVDSCINILQTAIQSATITSEDDSVSLLSLHRTLVEVLLDVRTYNEERRFQVLRALNRLVPEAPEEFNVQIVERYLHQRLENFLSEAPSAETEWIDTYFLPIQICEYVACYVYLLYVDNRSVKEILDIFDACLERTKGCSYLQERFHENEIAVLQLLNARCHGVHDLLVERLNAALDVYPDNFYLLSTAAGIQIELPHWKLATRKEIRPWQALATCLAGRARINLLQERDLAEGATAATNKLIYFHRRLSREPRTQHCPLVWRFFMLLLREQNLSREKGEEVYHESVAQCPWARSIYIDAAEVAPQVLTQIQDVIREKDLRMHVTPEELDILRG